MELPVIKYEKYSPAFPPWNIEHSSFIMDIAEHAKNNTPPNIFRSLFHDISDPLRSKGWKIVFTDGSKIQHSTSFVATYEDGSLLAIGILDNSASIFTAEAIAILNTATITSKLPGSFVICSDSLAVLKAIQNPNNTTNIISKIRDHLIKFSSKIKHMWIPGHTGIQGNEHADKAANAAHLSPVYVTPTLTKQDLLREVNRKVKEHTLNNWHNYQHFYKFNNIDKSRPLYPTSTSKQMNTTLVRLRLGHTTLTHQYLLKKENPPICDACQAALDVQHILGIGACKALTSNSSVTNTTSSAAEILGNLDPENIRKIHTFTKLHKFKI